MSFRVVLSIAEMWSASNACRRPNVHTSTPMPSLRFWMSRGDEDEEHAEPDHVEQEGDADEDAEAPPITRRHRPASPADATDPPAPAPQQPSIIPREKSVPPSSCNHIASAIRSHTLNVPPAAGGDV